MLLIKHNVTLTISFCGFLKNFDNKKSPKNQNSLHSNLEPSFLKEEGHFLRLKFFTKYKIFSLSAIICLEKKVISLQRKMTKKLTKTENKTTIIKKEFILLKFSHFP